MIHTLQALAVVISALIFMRAEPVLNHMGPGCWFPVRVAFWLLTWGPMALMLSVLDGYMPNAPTVAALAGVAVLLFAERRIRGLIK